jgi:hypothetical protein
MEIGRLMHELGGRIFESKGGLHAHKDNNSKILAVAHLDTVQKAHARMAMVQLERDTLIFSPVLDDRLGVYTILHALPLMGIKIDILFTENEERGMSTAADFTTEKQYNWIVEFDREGSDAVTYNYDWDDDVGRYFKLGVGSYSDICELEHLGCKGLNIGVGYRNPHTRRAYFVVEEYLAQMRKFAKFYRDNHDRKFAHEKIKFWPHTECVLYDDECISCEECGYAFYEDEAFFIRQTALCPYCGNEISEMKKNKKG